MKVIARAPTRIDLAGGTLDIWPLYLFLEEAVTINVAVNLYATATVETAPGARINIVSHDQNLALDAASLQELTVEGKLPLLARLVRHFAPEGGLRLETQCMAPAGSGLGGSSALAVAVAGALNQFTARGHSQQELIEVVRDIEAQVIRIPTGLQDYCASMYGGWNAWHFRVQKVVREPYPAEPKDIERRLLLFYSGLPRFSGINNWQVFKQWVDNEPQTVESLRSIRKEAYAVHDAFRSQNWNDVYEAIGREWLARRTMAPGISSPEVDKILEFGAEVGARTGRVCGAGGGGCLILLVRPDDRENIASQARQRGLPLLDFETVANGLTIDVS
jgi:D-glycero-alpha-D-manno-heptose-7-phosphate kinase